MKRLLPSILAAFALPLLLGGCVDQGPAVPLRYAPTNLVPVMPSGDFSAYIKAARAHAMAVNEAAGTPIRQADVAAVGPFELRPMPPGKDCKGRAEAGYDKGVLLIHGLNDTPFSMWDLAARFAKDCYLVRAILLPGHGTVPGDLLSIGLPAWRDAVAKAAWTFRGQVDRLVIAGFDLGANLALDAALDLGLPPEIELNGIVLMAPAFAFDAPSFAPAAVGPGGDALWGDIYDEQDALRYNAVSKASVAAVNQLGRQLLERQAPEHIPLFVVASADDVIADPQLVQRWFCSQVTTPRHLLWYTRFPDRPIPNCSCLVRSRDPNKNQLETCTFTHSSSFGPPSNQGEGEDTRSEAEPFGGGAILDMSHIALLAAPDNPRYGAPSERYDCRHYTRQWGSPEQVACAYEVDESKPYLRYGEASAGNLRNFVLRRLTYNPDFDHMATAILDFLELND